jgi:hypothetical protein
MSTMYLALKIGTVSVIDYFYTVLVDFVIERSHNSIVDTVTRLELHNLGFGFQLGQEIFSSPSEVSSVYCLF